jgi:hypothetical protein
MARTIQEMARDDGPVRKFYLIKQYGVALRNAGFDPRKMSCREIETAILTLTETHD